MRRISWKGHGFLGYPITGHRITHILEWQVYADGTTYRLERYKGKVLLHLFIPSPPAPKGLLTAARF